MSTLLRHLRDERGGALLTTMALTGAALFGILILLDFFGIYVVKRQGQAAADAAALGALQAAEKAFNQVARPALRTKLDALQQAINADVSSRMADWSRQRGSALRAQLAAVKPPLSPAEISQTIRDAIDDERPGVLEATRATVIHARVSDAEVAQALINGTNVSLVAGLRGLFAPIERGCLVKSVGAQQSTALREAATWFAAHNGASGGAAVVFPYQGEIKVRAVVTVPVPLGITARFAPADGRLLTVEATARAADLGGLAFDLSGSC